MLQVFSRKNDINGNPYRLMIVYGKDSIVAAWEARESIPNKATELRAIYYELPTVSLLPSEYTRLKKVISDSVCIEGAN